MLVGNFYAENKNFFLSVTSPVTLFSLKEPLELKLFHCAVSIAPLNFHRLKAVFVTSAVVAAKPDLSYSVVAKARNQPEQKNQ